MAKPLVFISYSPADEALKDQLLSHLDVLGRAGLVEVWSADQIGAGINDLTSQLADQQGLDISMLDKGLGRS